MYPLQNPKKAKYTIQPISYQYKQKHHNGINLTPPKNQNNKALQKNNINLNDLQYLANFDPQKNMIQRNSRKTPIRKLSESQYQINQQNFNLLNQKQEYQYQIVHLSLLEPSYPSVKQKPFQQIERFNANQLKIRINRRNNQQIRYNTGQIPFSNFNSIQKNIRQEGYYQNTKDRRTDSLYQQINSSEYRQPSPNKKKKQKLSVISTSGNKSQFSSSISKQKQRATLENRINLNKMFENQQIAEQKHFDLKTN